MISTQSVSFYQLVVLSASDSSSLSPLSISPIVCWRGCHIECPNLECHTFDCHRFECPFMSICLHVCPFLPNILWRCHPSQCCDRGGDCLGLSCLLPSPCLSVCLSVCAVNRSAPNSPPSFPNWLQLGRIEDDVRGIPPPGRPLIQNTFTTSNIADL